MNTNTNTNSINFDIHNGEVISGNVRRFIGWKHSLMDKFSFNTPRGKGYVDFLVSNIMSDSFLNEDEVSRLHCGIIIDFSSISFCMYKEVTKEEASNYNFNEYQSLMITYLANAIAEAAPHIEIKQKYSAVVLDLLKREVSIYGLLNTLYR